MKKIKLWLASLLTVLLCAVCFSGCGAMQGEYKLSSWKLPLIGTEITIDKASESYLTVNLEDDGVVTVSGQLAYNGTTYLDITTPQTGTWEKGEEKNVVEISVGNVFNVTATVKGGKMEFNGLFGTLTLKK